MALTYHVGNIIRGTTSDRTGGTWTNLLAGWIFIESDGKAIYRWNGSTWDLIASGAVTDFSGTLAVGHGGTGATTLTGVLKGNGTSAVTAAAQLAVTDGGTGAATLTGILKGNGTSAFTALTDPLPIANGGTSGATAAAGFDALSPMTTAGDIITGGASGTRTRLAMGTANQALKVNSGGTALDYGTLPIAGGGTGQTAAAAAFDALSGLTTAGDIIVGGASGARGKLALGTANQALKVNSGGTTLDYGTLPVAGGGTGATTLTGILKGNGTSAITAAALLAVADGGTGAGTLTGIVKGNGTSAFTAVTAPSGAIVGDTDVQALTNKTMAGATASNTFYDLQFEPHVKKIGGFMGASASNSFYGLFSGTVSTIHAGGASGSSAITRSSSGLAIRYSTGTTINSLEGSKVAGLYTERDLNPIMEWKVALSATITTQRTFFGLIASTSNPASGADPLNALAGVLFGYDSGVDGNWHIYQNDGTGASDSTTINNIAAADASIHYFALRAVNASAKFQYYYGATPYTATSTWTDINTDIPGATAGLAWQWWIEDLAGSAARTFDLYYIRHQQDG